MQSLGQWWNTSMTQCKLLIQLHRPDSDENTLMQCPSQILVAENIEQQKCQQTAG